jgi:nucleotide-binding universal stress UspA family protein
MAQSWLVPVDGFERTLRAVAWIVGQEVSALKDAPQFHLQNVQTPLPREINRFVDACTVREYHLEAGMAAIEPARARLAQVGIMAEAHVLIGDVASVIDEFARVRGCTQIIMGTRGHSDVTGSLLGSVATKVVHAGTVPLLLVR